MTRVDRFGTKNRITNLMALIETSAEAWWRLSSIIGQLFVRLETSMPPPEQVGPALAELHMECKRLGLSSADAQLTRIYNSVESPEYLRNNFRGDIKDLLFRISDELSSKHYLIVDNKLIDFYNQASPLFGGDVDGKFPSASEDISEAGKCIALERWTACVFHLMRAMEACLPSLCMKLGVTYSNKNGEVIEWGKMIANINDNLKTMPPSRQKDEWSELVVLLYHVKQAWRNSTMHPKQTYTEEEAIAVFLAVKTFMARLCAFV